jgi:hypothetical protein
MLPPNSIHIGFFFITTDGLFLQTRPGTPLNSEFRGSVTIEADEALAVRLNESFDHEDVSVLGHVSDRDGNGRSGAVATLHASNVVLKSDIAVRAFEISTSENRGSALDNWLQAESDLLIGVGE